MNIYDKEKKSKEHPEKLIPGIHYYVENGCYVFTEKYLQGRGYCCENGCRHCPYGFKKKG